MSVQGVANGMHTCDEMDLVIRNNLGMYEDLLRVERFPPSQWVLCVDNDTVSVPIQYCPFCGICLADPDRGRT